MAAEGTIGDRRTREAQLLSIEGFMSLADLVREVGVSESTVRRDLEVLEEQGLIKRAYGGAVFVKDTTHRLAFADREMTAAQEKRDIAAATAELIPENQTILLNGGTTCREVARALLGRRLSVVTNSVPIATLLSSNLDSEVTMIGGYVYPRTGVALGPTAVGQLRQLHATQLVTSCAGLAESGVFNANQMMVEVDRQMMEVAEQVILAVDHTKFGMRAVVKLCDVERVDAIVTDQGADEPTRRWLETLRCEVIYAEKAEAPPLSWRTGTGARVRVDR